MSARRILPEIAERVGVYDGCRVTLFGSKRALLEEHRGVLLCERGCVAVKTAAGELRVHGEALELTAMDSDALLITGRIFSVDVP